MRWLQLKLPRHCSDNVEVRESSTNWTLQRAVGSSTLSSRAPQQTHRAIAYRARSGDDTDRKIVTIVAEAGTITGRMVQTMFDVQPATASRILSDLVDRAILTKTSKATRGPGVTYGPGPKFPTRHRRRADLQPDDPTLLDPE